MGHSKLGILAAGGPAPGINSVIAAATIRARLSGIEVLGLRDGFRWIMDGNVDHTTELTIDNVWPIHFRGGSFIGINRANPVRDNKLGQTVDSLRRLGIDKLICIGGDGTAYTAARLLDVAGPGLQVVHVPKTIDNDLMLPDDIPTFGFQTARHVGVRIVQDLHMDAVTTSRWYFIVTMGRQAGHLALGIGKAASATLTLIPEEFPERVRLKEVVDVLTGAIIKRLSQGRMDGTAVIAEGLSDRIASEDLEAETREAERDMFGKVRLAEINLGQLLKTQVQRRLMQLPAKLAVTIQARNVGYELRCTDPIPFDMEYTRDLGYSATKYLLEGGTGAMITIQRGQFVPITFEDMLDPITHRSRVRNVDIETESYKIARRYMTRLRKDDFDYEPTIAAFAQTAGMTPEQFTQEFRYVVEGEAPPLRYAIPPSTRPPRPPVSSPRN
ncbi:MAG TPA: diphosphate--fructose-6-phosphate 1-phosphotransferase [Polyangiaceae bacterium]|jgi:6-phosphofructokinase 1|nr:diphosphate--fructose-6-phosphate 1-phosphotransferase [Polyangiaceae bacterium]